MLKIGSLGPVVFVVSPEAIRTFDNLQRSAAGRWADHDRIGQKPLSQFIGPGLDEITFTMQFLASARIDPRKEIDTLHALERSGRAVPLVIGGKGLGVGLWTLRSLNTSFVDVDGWGNVISGTANITIKEYVVKAK